MRPIPLPTKQYEHQFLADQMGNDIDDLGRLFGRPWGIETLDDGSLVLNIEGPDLSVAQLNKIQAAWLAHDHRDAPPKPPTSAERIKILEDRLDALETP